MLLKILKNASLPTSFSTFASTNKHDIESFKSNVQRKLMAIFAKDEKKILMAKYFRLFPNYFNTTIITEMIASEDFQDYYHYIRDKEEGANREGEASKEGENKQKELMKVLRRLDLRMRKDQKILQCYINFVRRRKDMSENDFLMEILDLRHPENWFHLGRVEGERKFIYNHGPTNSGKTFNAINELKSLSAEEKGIYTAPLRLLAWETQQKLGKCNLITGQEKDYQNSNLTSCTIETMNKAEVYDLAIIDEIQMIGDKERGWSWTGAILGIQAKKIHLCGDERALHLIYQLIKMSNGTLEQVKYNRLSKLHLISQDFELINFKPGDCLIDFSSKKLYDHRNKVNQIKGTLNDRNKTAIIYGKLPPICRKFQAEKFNNGELPYLVASNAIGMGLNLKIKRIIFTTLQKTDYFGNSVTLEDHEIRQIAGRAGRGMEHGFVQCTSEEIRRVVEKALRKVNITIEEKENILDDEEELSHVNGESSLLQSEDTSEVYCSSLGRYFSQDELRVKRAGLFIPLPIFERIYLRLQSFLNRRLKTSEVFFIMSSLCRENKDLYFFEISPKIIKLADALNSLNLKLDDLFIFISAPIQSIHLIDQFIFHFAKEFKENGQVQIPPTILLDYEADLERFTKIEQIQTLQKYFNVLEVYTWLWNHFELSFPHFQLANLIKERICSKISSILHDQAHSQVKDKGPEWKEKEKGKGKESKEEEKSKGKESKEEGKEKGKSKRMMREDKMKRNRVWMHKNKNSPQFKDGEQ